MSGLDYKPEPAVSAPTPDYCRPDEDETDRIESSFEKSLTKLKNYSGMRILDETGNVYT
jgi:hypothetical protein